MSELHETYEALLKAGMPPCEAVALEYEDGEPCWFMRQRGVTFYGVGAGEIAQALIDQWAGDWWLSKATKEIDRKIQAWSDGAQREVACSERDCTSIWTEDWEWNGIGSGPTVAEAVLAALAQIAGRLGHMDATRAKKPAAGE